LLFPGNTNLPESAKAFWLCSLGLCELRGCFDPKLRQKYKTLEELQADEGFRRDYRPKGLQKSKELRRNYDTW
jgi:hypothetical protein